MTIPLILSPPATDLTWVAPIILDVPREPALAAVATRRVLHIINGEHYAGAERVQDLLAMRLPECGFEVTFACMKPDRFPALRRSRECPLYVAAMRNRFDLWPARQLARLVHDEQISLIHTHTARSALVGSVAAALARVPMIHHVHSPALADTTHRWQNRVNAATERFTVRRAAAVVTVSSSLAEYVARRGLSGKPPVVVPNGVPVMGELPVRCRPTTTWMLGAVALFRPRKGLETLFDAMAQMVHRGHDVRLRAIGEFESPAYERTVRFQAEKLGIADRIDWRGFQTNVAGELAELDLFVLPSLFGEGMPMVVLEAMAAGVPVVATHVEGVSEVVRHGHDGLLVEPGKATELAGAVERFVDGNVDWQALRASAHRRQREQFSDESMARGVAEVYRRVLDG